MAMELVNTESEDKTLKGQQKRSCQLKKMTKWWQTVQWWEHSQQSNNIYSDLGENTCQARLHSQQKGLSRMKGKWKQLENK